MSVDARARAAAAAVRQSARMVVMPNPATIVQRLARRRRRRTLTCLALAVLAVVGVVTPFALSGGSSGVRISTGGPSGGSWSELPRAPISGRTRPYSVWTGHEMLIWAGQDQTQTVSSCFGDIGAKDGAAYNPTTRTWRRIATAPFAMTNCLTGFSGNPAAVWTGTEMLVFGIRGSVANAALAYNPKSNRWRILATPPTGMTLFGVSTVWTGHQVLIVSGGIDVNGTAGNSQGPTASYDPRTNAWNVTAAFPLAPRQYETVTWTGREMVVWGGVNDAVGPDAVMNDGAAYDPRTDTWRVLPRAPIAGRQNAGAAWTGHQLLIWGGLIGATTFGDGVAYEPTTDTWHTLAAANLQPVIPNATLWSGDRLLILGGRLRRFANGGVVAPPIPNGSANTGVVDQPTPDGAAYLPSTDTWLPISPEPTTLCVPPSAVWTGRLALLWGGQECPRKIQVPGRQVASTNRGASYTPQAAP
jgi:hypothetical protein